MGMKTRALVKSLCKKQLDRSGGGRDECAQLPEPEPTGWGWEGSLRNQGGAAWRGPGDRGVTDHVAASGCSSQFLCCTQPGP